MSIESINNLEHEYYSHPKNDYAYMLLHGVRGGIDEAYIQTIYGSLKARKSTVLAFNFPYMTRGEDRVSHTSFTEELDVLQTGYNFLVGSGMQRVHIIGKSIGGIILSYWLKNKPDINNVDASIMGYITGPNNVQPEALRGRLKCVIQGEYDRYADVETVTTELAAHNVDSKVIEIPGADHSYRDMVNPNPAPYAFQVQAIAELLKYI